jgi:ribosomal-protein-alanine N-acetyltransferase
VNLSFADADPRHIEEFCSWTYPEPYERYSLDSSAIPYFLTLLEDPQGSLTMITDPSGQLIAYVTTGTDARVPGGDYAEELIDIGLGIRPELTGRGLGTEIVAKVLGRLEKSFPGLGFRVTIAEFNHRAQKVWMRNGFVESKRFISEKTGDAFLILTRER